MNLKAWGKAWADGTWADYAWELSGATPVPIANGGKIIKEDYYFDFPVFDDNAVRRKKRKRNEMLLLMN